MQEALSKRQLTPLASAGSGDSGCVALGHSTMPSLPFHWPLSRPLSDATVRTQVQRFHLHTVFVLLVFMETLKVTFQTPLTHPSIHWSPSFHRESSPQPVPGTVLSHEDEDTAASKIPLSPTKKKRKIPVPMVLACRWEILPHPFTITRPQCEARGAGAAFALLPFQRKGPPPE